MQSVDFVFGVKTRAQGVFGYTKLIQELADC